MNKRRIGVAAIVLLLLTVGVVLAMRNRVDPQVEKIKQMQKDAFAGNTMPKPEQMEAMRKEVEKLSPAQRQKLWEDGGRQMGRRMQKAADEYAALPPDKKEAYLDERIKDMENMRKEWEKNRPAGGGPPGGPQGGQQPGGARGNQPGGGQAGSNAGGNGPRGPFGGNASPESRSQWHNQMLDNTSPEQRAKMTAFMSALMQRRAALGLPAFGPPGGGGPGR